MRSKKTPIKVAVKDPVYGSELVAKIISGCMYDGKKTVAAKHVYKALDIIGEQSGKNSLEYLSEAVENVKPTIEVRSRRVGGASYQVPTPIRPERRDSLSVRWIMAAARAKGNNP